MIALAEVGPAAARSRFLAMLPLIQRLASAAFRSRGPEARAEAVQEVVASAYVAFVRLVELGKEQLAYATPLALYAIRQVLRGRRVGSKQNVRDVLSPVNHHVVVKRLDRADPRDGGWRETIVEDRHAGPAETAAARIDVGDWFCSLPAERRQIATTLAAGESTAETARQHQVSPARVSQLRRELRTSWRRFQGELASAAAAAKATMPAADGGN